MTAEYETFHTIGGDTERVLVGVRGPAVYAPDLRPNEADGAAAPMETGSGHQLEHQMHGTVTIGGQQYTATMQLRRAEPEPEKPSGIGDIHCTIPAAVVERIGPLDAAMQRCRDHLRISGEFVFPELSGTEAAALMKAAVEPLAKVLPAGGPLLPGHPADKTPVWRCEGCGLLSTTQRRPVCLQSRMFGCPMVKS